MGEANLTATVLYFFNTEHCNNLIDQCNIVRQNTCIEMFNCNLWAVEQYFTSQYKYWN